MNIETKEFDKISVSAGSWASLNGGTGKYEICLVYRENEGYVLVYEDVHRDGVSDDLEEKICHREIVLGYDYFRKHSQKEFSQLLSKLTGDPMHFIEIGKYQEFCKMELNRMGIEKKEYHAPLPKNEDLTRGATVLFGSYFQEDEIHKTPIEWIVLESNDGVALLISKKALIVSGYCDYKKAYGKYLEYAHSEARRICEYEF